MAIVRGYPIVKYMGVKKIETSKSAVISNSEYVTQGEDYIIVKKVDECKITLNSDTSDHITIKALTNVLIVPDKGLIDEEFGEVSIGIGACVEFVFCIDNWYIVSSDGLKMD